MITKSRLHDLRVQQLKPYPFPIRSISLCSYKTARIIENIVNAYGRKCLISLADGGIMLDAESDLIENTLLYSRLTCSFFEPPPPPSESTQERLDKLEETCESLLSFKEQAIIRIMELSKNGRVLDTD